MIALGSFDLQERIGVGGMGEVWRARHRSLAAPVAVKVVRSRRTAEPGFRRAFRNEIIATARLSHPGIVTLLDYGEIDEKASLESHGSLVTGSPFLAMELVEGGSLLDLPELPHWIDVKALLHSILTALSYAHSCSVIHRDIKPGNVLVRAPNDPSAGVKVTDFGLAWVGKDGEGEDLIAQGSGTPHYMAPEQFDKSARDCGPWTDLYGVGCVAFELITGQPPFGGGGYWDVGLCHLNSPAPPIATSMDIPTGAQAWIHQLLAKDPTKRYRSAVDAARDLDGLGKSVMSIPDWRGTM